MRIDVFMLSLLVAISVLGPVIAVRVRLPAAVVLMIAGVVLGPSLLGFLKETPFVSLASDLGFWVLMFIAGMELDFDSLRERGARGLVGPLGIVLGCFAVGALVGGFLGLNWVDVLAICCMSVGMPIAVLTETRQTKTALGRLIVLTASAGEFVCILIIIGYEIIAHSGLGVGLVWSVAKVIALFVVCALAIRFSRAVVWWWPERFERMVEHHDAAELGVRGGLLVMLGFVLLTALVGVEPILGAFIGGALIAFVLRERVMLETKIAALGNGLFIPIFFVIVGVRFRPGELDLSALSAAGLLTLLAGAVKLGPTLLFARELRPLERVAAASLLSAPLTLVVAVAEIAREFGAIDARHKGTLLLAAMGFSALYPAVFRVLVGIFSRRREAVRLERAQEA
jgi:Kef-type K+ transport system membrane component KefB